MPSGIPSAQRARNYRDSGVMLLILAGLAWTFLAVLLCTPYETERNGSCDAPAFADRTANSGDCASERPWPKLMSLLAASVPLSVAGTALYASGSGTLRLHALADELARRAPGSGPAPDPEDAPGTPRTPEALRSPDVPRPPGAPDRQGVSGGAGSPDAPGSAAS
ncbi:hypothetical protein [Streptomyces sp. NPDC057702]|uniref:hypothetical protein n=1 Tax=unclassified Streptomyces TaxID=2593676 RepID=UPI0036BC9BA2